MRGTCEGMVTVVDAVRSFGNRKVSVRSPGAASLPTSTVMPHHVFAP